MIEIEHSKNIIVNRIGLFGTIVLLLITCAGFYVSYVDNNTLTAFQGKPQNVEFHSGGVGPGGGGPYVTFKINNESFKHENCKQKVIDHFKSGKEITLLAGNKDILTETRRPYKISSNSNVLVSYSEIKNKVYIERVGFVFGVLLSLIGVIYFYIRVKKING